VQLRRALRRLHEILAELDPKVRLAFSLHVLDGQPLADVAAAMRSSVVATKSRIWRARRRLLRDPQVSSLVDLETAP
jgi:DNA-directed RNA polymerase specialized sigma24 family protein